MPPLQDDNDTTGDVISLNGQATATVDPPEAKEDRGDVVQPELALDTLKAVVKGAPVEDPAPAATEAKPNQAPQHIPKARFDEVNNERKRMADELAEANRVIESLKTPRPAAVEVPQFDADEAEQRYIEALLDNDTTKARAIRQEINHNLIAQATEAATAISNEQYQQRQTATSLMDVGQQAVATYPYLDTEEGEEALELIIASRDAKVAKGMSFPEALRSAVESIAPRFAPADGTPPVGVADKPLPTDTRTAAALARGAADSNLQPAQVGVGTGNRATAGRVNVAEMSEEQFDNLTPAEKKRLRGDA